MPHTTPGTPSTPPLQTLISADDSSSPPLPGASQTVLLTIAGFDPSSGAGITADLLTFAAHGFFGTSAATALTVQSTQGVFAVEPTSPELLRETLTTLQSDLPPAGIKIGMLATPELAHVTSVYLQALCEGLTRKLQIPIVLDPILRSSSGATLLTDAALKTMHSELLPFVSWITPNWSELADLSTSTVTNPAQAESAAHTLGTQHPHLTILVTGGDQSTPTDLLRLPSGAIHTFPGDHISSTNTHGTGCALSSALLCRLVHGDDAITAVDAAKHYVREAILRAPNLGHGKGPLNLLWPLKN